MGRYVAAVSAGLMISLLGGSSVGAAPVDPQCTPPSTTAPCDDGDPCTQDDRCRDGTCVGHPSFWLRTRARVGNGASLASDMTVHATGGELALGRRAHAADGVRCAADHLRLGPDARAFDVAYNRVNRAADRATIAGATISPLALAPSAPFCPMPSTSCGGPDVTLAPGELRDLLAPQAYGRLRVGGGATLTLAPGTFAFCEISIARDASVLTLGPDPTLIGVAGNLVLGPSSHLGPGSGSPRPRVHVDGSRVRIGRGASLEALCAAPAAYVRVGSDALVNGTLCADRLATGRAAALACTVACGDAIVTTDEGCDDGNTAGGDGCSPNCLVECGGSVCVPGEICLGGQCFAAAP